MSEVNAGKYEEAHAQVNQLLKQNQQLMDLLDEQRTLIQRLLVEKPVSDQVHLD